MDKKPNYRKEIQDYVSSVHNKPFKYGSHDCATFGADVIHAATGVDVWDGLRGRYSTYLGGVRVLKKATGYTNHVEYFKSFCEEIEPPFGRYGDLCYFIIPEQKDCYSIGLVFGHFAVAITEQGLIRKPLNEIEKVLRYA